MSTLAVTADEKRRLVSLYPQVFAKSFGQRWGLLVAALGTLVYLLFCYSFFDVGPAFVQGHWERASTYVQDWYSWRAQPRLKLASGAIKTEWSSRGQYRPGTAIDWLTPNADGSMTIDFGAGRVVVAPTEARVLIDGAVYPMALGGPNVIAPENAPAPIAQDGDKVMVDFGFAGSAEIRPDQIRVQRRFLGWSNFFFDTKSAFWGRGFVEVMELLISGERLDPAMTNIQLAMHDFTDNQVWQHGDILSKLLQTLVMAFVGTLLATVLALPLAFVAARSITQNRLANWLMKRGFDFLRSIDMLIWALFFTRSFGPGPIPGIAAIFFTDTGSLGKVYAEALENVDDKQREGVQSVGASPGAVNRYGVVPQVLPVFISQSLYFWESNTRSATVIGAVGAGGIGLKLLEAMKTNADWDKVAYMVLLILGVIFLFDNVSNAVRSRLIGGRG
jgi:phosphonate transport system permease protein